MVCGLSIGIGSKETEERGCRWIERLHINWHMHRGRWGGLFMDLRRRSAGMGSLLLTAR